MCGIAGVVGEGAGYHESINARVTAIKHRGPDSEGFFVEPGIELGMARLSIIDVAQGSQPVFNEDRKIMAVFNGEIYNHKRLRDELITTGHRFNSHSDSEVITHLYEEYGIEGIQKLNGMFAIAIWDSVSRVLFLIRDRFGEKPLFYENLKSGGLAFGSEVRSLMASGNENSRRPNFDTLNHILTFGYSPLSESAFAGINSIPPGSYLRWKQGVVEVKKYWNPPVVSQNFYRSYSEAKDATKVALEEAIALRMESERPLGVFLSGGVDSSLIAAFASQKSAKPLSTFTIGFRDNAYNESQWARNIARHLGTDHHEIILNPDPKDTFAELGRNFDQPFADSSAIPTMLVSRFARENAVVVLSGDGGDELFLGYQRYAILPKLQRANAALGLLSLPAAFLVKYANFNTYPKFERLALQTKFFPNLNVRFLANMTLAGLPIRSKVLSQNVKANILKLDEPENSFNNLWNELLKYKNSDARIMSLMDMNSYLPGDILVKVDISSMAYGLEVRAPFLDHNLAEVAARTPEKFQMDFLRGKSILRDLVTDYVPEALIDRPKMGFAIPRAAWLRKELREEANDLLTGSITSARGWFNIPEVKELLNRHQSGQNLDHVIWPLMSIEVWARNWLDA